MNFLDQERIGLGQEQPVADDTGRLVERRGELHEVHSRGQRRIDDEVPVVRLVLASARQPRSRASRRASGR